MQNDPMDTHIGGSMRASADQRLLRTVTKFQAGAAPSAD